MSAGNTADNDANALVHTRSLSIPLAHVQHLQPLAMIGGAAHIAPLTRETVNRICQTLQGAELTDPWGDGHHAWKIGGKMFAMIGMRNDGVSVKTDSVETAQMLIDAGVGIKAPYFHRSWIRLEWGCDEGELDHRLRTSYDLVFSKLTKKARAEIAGGCIP